MFAGTSLIKTKIENSIKNRHKKVLNLVQIKIYLLSLEHYMVKKSQNFYSVLNYITIVLFCGM